MSRHPDWNEFDDVDTRIDVDDLAAQRYERACVATVEQYIPSRISQMRAIGREPDRISLDGRRPRTRLVVVYKTRGGKTRELSVRFWGDASDRIVSSNPKHLAHPNDIADIVTINLCELGPDSGARAS